MPTFKTFVVISCFPRFPYKKCSSTCLVCYRVIQPVIYNKEKVKEYEEMRSNFYHYSPLRLLNNGITHTPPHPTLCF